MQSVRVWKNDSFRGHCRACLLLGRGRCAVECQGQYRSLPNICGARSINHARNTFAVRDDHFGQQALGIGRHVIQFEFDQRRARFDLVTYLYLLGETLALQRDSIDDHMH